MINQKHWQTSPSSESGFTIIESLVAILIASVLLTAIAPVIVLSVATRVQAKRIETATDAAKGYIDGVRSGVIDVDANKIAVTNSPSDYPAPTTTGTLTCGTGDSYCTAPATNLYCMDVDGNNCSTSSARDYVIQAFRYGGTETISGVTSDIINPSKGYYLGVRVYRADAFAESGVLNSGIKQATFTGGLGDRKTPLVEMTTEITKGVEFSAFCNRLKQTNPQSTCS